MRLKSLSWVVLSLVLATAQLSTPQNTPMQIPPFERKPGPGDDARIRMQKEMAKKANAARQADLKRDTEKLLKLSTQLKEYVDKTNEDMLSVEVVKKAEEIEKLAHSVKDKMKGGY